MKSNSYRWIIDLIIEYAIKLFILVLIVFIFNQVMFGNLLTGRTGYSKEYVEVKELKYHKAYQFFNYLGKLITLDLGKDPMTNAPVTFFVGGGLLNSCLLFFPSIIFSVLIAYWIGKSYYLKKQNLLSKIIKGLSSFISSIPIYWLAYIFFLLILLVGGFEIGGTSSWKSYDTNFVIVFLDRVWHLILPWIPMITFITIVLSQAIQTKIVQLEKAVFIKMAEAKGLPKKLILKRHLSSPIWAELLATLSSYLPFFITYLVVVELVFNYQGLGFYCIMKSYPIQNAAILFLGMFVIVIQFLNTLMMKIFIPYLRREQVINIKSTRNYWVILFIIIVSLLSIVQNMFGISMNIDIKNFDVLIRVVLFLIIFSVTIAWIFIERQKQLKYHPKKIKSIIEKEHVSLEKIQTTIKKVPEYVKQTMSDKKKKALRNIIIGFFIVIIVIVIGFFISSDIVKEVNINRNTVDDYINPSSAHPMGVLNVLGTAVDYLQLILLSSRYLLIPIISAVLGLFIGAILGVVCGLWKSIWDYLLTRIFEFIEMFPSVLLLIIILAFFNLSIFGFMFTLILIGAARTYRIIREEVIILRQQEFISAVKLLGSNFWNILRKHIFPNIKNLFFTSIFNLIADFIILDATLIYITRYILPSFLANIIPVQGWGLLISSSIDSFVRGDLLVGIFPGLFLVGIIIIFRWIGNNASMLVKKLDI